MVRRQPAAFYLLAIALVLPFSALADQNGQQPQPPAGGDEATSVDKALSEGLAKLVGDPTKENYLAVRKLVVSHPQYDPYSRDLEEINRLATDPKNEELQKKAKAAFPNLLLSPRYHTTLKIAALWRGEEKLLVSERRIAAACLMGILATGDGTPENPYFVVRLSDEYDVLGFLGKGVESQGLMIKGERKFDVLQCADGSEVWFDITDVFAQLAKRRRGSRDVKPPELDP